YSFIFHDLIIIHNYTLSLHDALTIYPHKNPIDNDLMGIRNTNCLLTPYHRLIPRLVQLYLLKKGIEKRQHQSVLPLIGSFLVFVPSHHHLVSFSLIGGRVSKAWNKSSKTGCT